MRAIFALGFALLLSSGSQAEDHWPGIVRDLQRAEELLAAAVDVPSHPDIADQVMALRGIQRRIGSMPQVEAEMVGRSACSRAAAALASVARAFTLGDRRAALPIGAGADIREWVEQMRACEVAFATTRQRRIAS